MSLVSIKNLAVAFQTRKGEVNAVRGVSLELERGETLAVVGESGSGKSVSAMSVLGLIPTPPGRYDGGRILWRGGEGEQGLLTLSEEKMRKVRGREVAMIFQEPMTSLNPLHRVEKQIGEILRVHQGLRENAARARTLELLNAVGIRDPETKLESYPHQLSGGQKARVGIARAIALNPKLLILDEPTSALDVSVQAVILHLLADLKERLGMSYLFVSHDLNVVRLLCDRILVMYLGKIVESGPVEQIFNQPRHPYTEALISAIPSFEAKPQPIPLTGEPRSPINPDPNVCRLYGRCPKSDTLCQQTMPILEEVAPNHWAACHFSP